LVMLKGNENRVRTTRSKNECFFFLLYTFGKKGERSQQERSNEKRFFISNKKLLHV